MLPPPVQPINNVAKMTNLLAWVNLIGTTNRYLFNHASSFYNVSNMTYVSVWVNLICSTNRYFFDTASFISFSNLLIQQTTLNKTITHRVSINIFHSYFFDFLSFFNSITFLLSFKTVFDLKVPHRF